MKGNKQAYIQRVQEILKQGIKYNKRTIEKLAESYGIINKNLVKEYTELAIVLNARAITQQSGLSLYEQYQAIVELYQSQINLSLRTSMSVLMQQYSTPAPISFLASSYVLSQDPKALYFEPSAGNGLLSIALPYAQTYVNELDDIRLENLQTQPFAEVTQQDATRPFKGKAKMFKGVVSNPPFGRLDPPILFDDFKIKRLEHAMCINALKTMADNGKSALIIGGHTDWDERGRVRAGHNRIFLNYLYHFYNVEDVIAINGKKLYSRQGTSINVRLILINGRKKQPQGASPLKNDLLSTVIDSHQALWDRVGLGQDKALDSLKLKAQALLILQEQKDLIQEQWTIINDKIHPVRKIPHKKNWIQWQDSKGQSHTGIRHWQEVFTTKGQALEYFSRT